jgi:hypothetical protein
MDVKDLLGADPSEWPDSAGEVLLETLTNKQSDPDDRLAAARLAGELVVMNEELAAILLEIVSSGDEPEHLRMEAAIGLGPVLEQGDLELIDGEEFDDPESVPISLETFVELREALHKLYLNESNPKGVRRKILEAAVRAPQEWQVGAIKTAYASGNKGWMITAVFGMGFVPGFEAQIVKSLQNTDPDIHYEAVRAAGRREVDAAWPHVVRLVKSPAIPKPLRLAAIEAVGSIRPKEAGVILVDLTDSPDQEIAEAANEAMMMADAMSGGEDEEEEQEHEGEDEDNDEDDGEWVN